MKNLATLKEEIILTLGSFAENVKITLYEDKFYIVDCFDGVFLDQVSNPKLTTVKQNLFKLGELLSGMTTLDKELQPENELIPMLVTLLGMTMLDRELQSLNTPLPMLVTLFGITILDRDIQPTNAHPPMLVTLFGITISVRELQF